MGAVQRRDAVDLSPLQRFDERCEVSHPFTFAPLTSYMPRLRSRSYAVTTADEKEN
jgi:hypothetical protein